MDSKKLRSRLSFIIVGGFSFITFLIVVLIVVGFLQAEDGKDILKSFSSIFSGFVGIILGYYFTGNSKSNE